MGMLKDTSRSEQSGDHTSTGRSVLVRGDAREFSHPHSPTEHVHKEKVITELSMRLHLESTKTDTSGQPFEEFSVDYLKQEDPS